MAPHHSAYNLGMERRSALKSMLAALTAVTSGSLTMAAKEPPSTGAPRSNTMIETPDGIKLHFRDWGSGRPIVFVAPWGLCSDWWDIPVMNFVEHGWRCVTFDRRGHARSEDPCSGYDFDTLADDISAVMDGLDLQDVVLVGHSMGGAEVARYLTRHRSRRVTHAVLIAPTTPLRLKTDDNPSDTSHSSTIFRIAPRWPRRISSVFPKTPSRPRPWTGFVGCSSTAAQPRYSETFSRS